jgi:hypothetical protein
MNSLFDGGSWLSSIITKEASSSQDVSDPNGGGDALSPRDRHFFIISVFDH